MDNVSNLCACHECKLRREAEMAKLEENIGLIGGGKALEYDEEIARLDPYYEYYLDMSAPAHEEKKEA